MTLCVDDAGYYGYLWSQVFSADMYHGRFKREGLLSAACGLDYRIKILQPGGSQTGMQCLVGFLGREPTSDAFFSSIGLTPVESNHAQEL
jgi:Zn-dependent oligopeptidase